MAAKAKPAQRAETFATVLTVVSWTAIIPCSTSRFHFAFGLSATLTVLWFVAHT